PAFLLGVSDAGQFQQALGEYRTILNDLISKLGDLAGPGFPAVQIPAPETSKLKAGTLYFYHVPEQVGLDQQISPNVGVGDAGAVFSVSPKQTERMLNKTPLKAEGGPLAGADRPRASAVYVDCAGLIKALAPWVELAVQRAAPDLPPQLAGDGPDGLLKQ